MARRLLYHFTVAKSSGPRALTHPRMSAMVASVRSTWNQMRPHTTPRPTVWTQLSLESMRPLASRKLRWVSTDTWVQKEVGHLCSRPRSSWLLNTELPASDHDDRPESSSSRIAAWATGVVRRPWGTTNPKGTFRARVLKLLPECPQKLPKLLNFLSHSFPQTKRIFKLKRCFRRSEPLSYAMCQTLPTVCIRVCKVRRLLCYLDAWTPRLGGVPQPSVERIHRSEEFENPRPWGMITNTISSLLYKTIML